MSARDHFEKIELERTFSRVENVLFSEIGMKYSFEEEDNKLDNLSNH